MPNESNILDADTMFENWVASRDPETRRQLVKDFEYYYATDPRNEYMAMFNDNHFMIAKDTDRARTLIAQFFSSSRFEQYKYNELKCVQRVDESKAHDKKMVIVVIIAIAVISVLSWYGIF